jgi:hypothetical protein
LSRHRKTQFSRSKAILVAAGALSVATAASATAATWTSGASDGHTGRSGTAGFSIGNAQSVSSTPSVGSTQSVTSTQGASGALRLTVTDELTWPQAEAAYQQTSVTLAQRTDQVRAAQTRYADAQWSTAQKRSAARATVAAVQSAATTQSPDAASRQTDAASRPTGTASRPTGTASRPTGTATVKAASGSPQQIAEAMLGSFGWSSGQFSCLDPLWEHESGWSVSAYNASSGAAGIPQALPGSRMASAGPDWQTDAATQIRWGLEYIKSTYGSPCAAWDHEEATGWY